MQLSVENKYSFSTTNMFLNAVYIIYSILFIMIKYIRHLVGKLEFLRNVETHY